MNHHQQQQDEQQQQQHGGGRSSMSSMMSQQPHQPYQQQQEEEEEEEPRQAVEAREIGKLKVKKGTDKWMESPDKSQGSHSPTRERLTSKDSVRQARNRINSNQRPLVEQQQQAAEPESAGDSPTRQSLQESGAVANRLVSNNNGSSGSSGNNSRVPSAQNDADEVVASGALVRAAESFGNSILKAKQTQASENDAEASVALGQAKENRGKFEAAASAAQMAKRLAEQARARLQQQPFKHPLTKNSAATPMLSLGSVGMSGMARAPNSANPIMRGVMTAGPNEDGGDETTDGDDDDDESAASRRQKKKKWRSDNTSAATPMLSLGSVGMSGMSAANKSSDPITRGAANMKPLSDAEVSLFGMGSTYMPGMQKDQRGVGEDGGGGDGGGNGAGSRASENMLGAVAGKPLHQGATFVTAGSLHAPGMAKSKYVSPEVAGAAAGHSSDGSFGTLLTNGSVHAPGMARSSPSKQKQAGGGVGGFSSAVGPSVDRGLSLFAMGSLLSQSKAEEARQASKHAAELAEEYGDDDDDYDDDEDYEDDDEEQEGGDGEEDKNGVVQPQRRRRRRGGARPTSTTGARNAPGSNTFGSTFKAAGSADLPLWSLGSSVSVAALAETSGKSGGAAVASGNTFGAAVTGSGGAFGGGPATNSAVPLWSIGSAATPGMQRSASGMGNSVGVRTITSASAGQGVGGGSSETGSGGCTGASATLMSFGSSGAPGMARERPLASGNMLGASAAAAAYGGGEGGDDNGGDEGGKPKRGNWKPSYEPSLLMMGSAAAPGMKRDSAGGAGLWSNTAGAASGAPLSSKFWQASTFASYDPSSTTASSSSSSSNANVGFDGNGMAHMMTNASSAVSSSMGGVRGNAWAANASGQSVDAYGGTMVTSGSANQVSLDLFPL
jgi:hypothetical protein